MDGEGKPKEPKLDQLAGAFRVVLRIQQTVQRKQDEQHEDEREGDDLV